MPRSKSVHTVFEEFVSSLSALIKVKVAEAVQAATNDFFAAKFGQPVSEEPKPVPKRRRRRRGVKNLVKKVAAVVGRKRGRKPGRKPGPKTVKLSKHGKRLGRPPKAAAPAAEETKTV